MAEKTFKAALFDFDGTLCDSEPHYVRFWNAVGRKYRPDIDCFGYRVQGIPPKVAIQTHFPHAIAEVTAALEDMEANLPYEWFPGALEFLSDLRAHGVKCAVVTSSNRIKMSHVAKRLPGFEQLFDAVLTMEQFTRPKPFPDCFLLGASALGCAPDECVVFEDSFSGLKAGMDSGIFTVGMADTHSHEELAERCDFILDSFENATYDTIATAMKSKPGAAQPK